MQKRKKKAQWCRYNSMAVNKFGNLIRKLNDHSILEKKIIYIVYNIFNIITYLHSLFCGLNHEKLYFINLIFLLIGV